MNVADDFIPQFRRIAQERLDRVEVAWQLVLTSVDDDAAALIHREIHTLKGESRMLGFIDVHLVCNKLEDLLEAARVRGYAIDDDFDLAVNMALRFLAMLIRKKVGAQLSGIDLPGFVRQIDAILADARHETSDGRIRQNPQPKTTTAPSRIPLELRARLANLAVDAFIEYAHAQGNRRNRLRGSWHSIRDLIALQRAVIGPAQLAKHEANVCALAIDLQKPIEMTFEVETAEVTTEILNATDVAILHLLRNAIDHGIETTATRIAAGKPPVATIRICSGLRDGVFVFSVADDGAGIDYERVHARAVELGLVRSDVTETFDRDRWIDIMCHPGLSTRNHTSDLSGRGVGLNAVRTTVSDVGGKLTMSSGEGKGTTWSVTIPISTMTVQANVFRAPGLPFPIAVDKTWTPSDEIQDAPIIDLASHLGMPIPSPPTAKPLGRAWFVRGDDRVGFVVDEPPTPAWVRRLVITDEPAPIELITHEAVEGLLLRAERFIESARLRGSGMTVGKVPEES